MDEYAETLAASLAVVFAAWSGSADEGSPASLD
jgi:hypothetical protein